VTISHGACFNLTSTLDEDTVSVTTLRHRCAGIHPSQHTQNTTYGLLLVVNPHSYGGRRTRECFFFLLSHSTLWSRALWYIQMDSIHLPLGLRIRAGTYYGTNLSFSLLFYQLYLILYSSRFRTSYMSLWEGTGNPNSGIGFSHTHNTPENPMQDYGKEIEELTYSSQIFNIFRNFYSRGLQYWFCIFCGSIELYIQKYGFISMLLCVLIFSYRSFDATVHRPRSI
jgi:hypothetical protein